MKATQTIKTNWMLDHIDASFDNSDFEEDLSTIGKKVAFLKSEIERVAMHPHNIKKFKGNRQSVIADYLQGLPLTIPFSYYEILELKKNWGYDKTSDEKFISNYWSSMAMLILQVFKKYQLEIKG